MKNLKHLALAALSLALAACATTGPAYHEMAEQIPAPGADSGRIFFYLTEYPVKTALIKVDGDRVGTLTSMSFFYVDRPAGEYTVQVYRGRTGIISLDKLAVTLAPGQERYVEVLGIDRRLKLLLTDPADARTTLHDCTYMASSSDEEEQEKP